MQRRRILSGLIALPAALALSAAGHPARAAAPATARPADVPRPTRPNIVFILGDDFGWTDVSTPRTNLGNPSDYYETPTIERLAQEGMAFDNAYASPNCSPSRAALLTGLYAVRPDNNVYAVDSLNRGGDDTMLVGPAEGRADGADVLPTTAVTIGSTLRRAGYRTGYIGKFHVTRNSADITAAFGFDENFGGSGAGDPGSYHASNGHFGPNISPELDTFAADYTQNYIDRNIKPYAGNTDPAAIDALVGTPKHVTDAIADATIDFVDRHKDGRFFAFMAHYAVHAPVADVQARADLLAKYKAKKTGTGPSVPAYGALGEGLDQSVARVVDYLRTTADPNSPGRCLADNTIVVITGDNGGLGLYTDNGPLRGQKGELHEGGIRVPLIAWSTNPALVQGHTINHTPVYVTDYHPTFAALAGATLPAGRPLDGVDLSHLFADATAELDRDALYWHLPGYLVDGRRNQRPQSVIRSGQWKLLYNYEDFSWELYDLAADIGETHNIAAERPGLVHLLGHKLIRWLLEAQAPLAVLREGRPPLSVTVTGTTYANGRTQHLNTTTLVVKPGEQLPLVLQRH